MTDGRTPAAILAAMTDIMRHQCDHPHLALSTDRRLEDIPGLDSLRILQTVALLEEHFRVEIDVVGLDGMHTVSDLVTLISDARRAC